MRFWDDMQTKYGYSDGDATPDGVEVYRTVYIRAVNRLAEQLGSRVRAVAYNRFGVHNSCLIILYRLCDLEGQECDLTLHTDLAAGEAAPDEAMGEAIRQAYELDLDNFVQVFVTIDDNFDTFVTQLSPISERDPLIAEVKGQPQHIYPGGRVRLLKEKKTSDGRLLGAGSEYAVTWIDHRPGFVGIGEQSNASAIAIVCAEEVFVSEIPGDIRMSSENCQPSPPFHLCDMDDETLDEYSVFYDWNAAQTAMQRAVRELGKSIQIVNGYSNTVMSCDPDESE
jgi:hypothetical protein